MKSHHHINKEKNIFMPKTTHKTKGITGHVKTT